MPAKNMLARENSLVTSQAVLLETWMLISRKIGIRAAERFWGGLKSGVAKIEPVTAADFDAAWDIGRQFADADFSIVDRTSFAVMQRLRMNRVAAFDHHFSIYRYGPNGDRAFSVIRD